MSIFGAPDPLNPPKGKCLQCNHVHCDFCEKVWPVEEFNVRSTAKEVFIHIRDEHRDEWLADPEYAQIAITFGVESI